MTEALSAFGTLLKIGDGGGTEVFTTIAEVKNVRGPGFSLDTDLVTSHSSPGGWKEKIGTLLDGGQVTFDISFVPTNATHSYAAGLLKDLVDRTKRNFKIVFPDTGATTWSFTALVVGFPVSAPVDGTLEVPVTLEITGQPTLA